MKVFRNKAILYLICIFVFTLLFSLLIPMGGDDWGMYLRKGLSLSEIFELSKWFYTVWEGRFFARIFSLLLIPHEVLWAFVNSILMTLLFYFMYKILDSRIKYLPFILLGILFVDYQTFAQVYVWRTGNIFYFIPIVYAFFLIYVRRNLILNKEVNIKWWNYLLIPLTLMSCMFVENVAIAIIIICLLNLILYYLKYKKIDKPMFLCMLAAIIGFCLMYFSPGTKVRIDMEDNFTSLSIVEKILQNIPNLINYTFIKNSFIVFLFIIVMSVIIWRNIKNQWIKFFLLGFIIVPAGITMALNAVSPFVTLPNILLKVLNPVNVFVDVYWIIFTILFIFLIIYYLKIDKFIFYFLTLSILSAGSMMVSPTWGGRTACFTTYMLFMTLAMVINRLDLKFLGDIKGFIFMNAVCLIFIVGFSVYSIYIFNLNNDRVKYINYQLEKGKKDIEVIILPGYYTWNLNTWGSDGDFAYNFKKAFAIDKEALLIYVKREDIDIDVSRLNVSSKMEG